MFEILRLKLLELLGGVDNEFARQREADYGDMQYQLGVTQAKTHWRVLPLPFSENQLAGANYGEFITPRGFAVDAFGECNVPACGTHGYEQRAMYVSRSNLDNDSYTLTCHHPKKFETDMIEPGVLVPVIVTVLR